MKRTLPALSILALLAVLLAAVGDNVVLPGRRAEYNLLPNGWKLTPAGEHVTVGDLPLRMMLSPNRRHILAATNGYNDQGLVLLDAATGAVQDRLPLWQTFHGLDARSTSATAAAVYLAGGRSGKVHVIRAEFSKLALEDTLNLPVFDERTGYVTGLTLVPQRNLLLVLNAGQDTLYYYDWKTRAFTRTLTTRYRPYHIVADKAGVYAYISNWGDKSVSRLNIATGEFDGLIPAGDHPSDMVFSPDEKRLFVANANSDTVSVLDVAKLEARETVAMGLTPRSPQGALPNALGISPDGKTLAVANAGNNDVALVDVGGDAAKVLGFIPTGWYPTSALFSPDGKNLFVGNGKGLGSSANPKGPVTTLPPDSGWEYQFIRRLIPGAISRVPVPDSARLAAYTRQVQDNAPYTDERLETAAGARAAANSILPARNSVASPIKHVIYIIKENRTYDQVLGDMKTGNGDPSLVLFGENVTPNHHKISREFVLLDNFYVNGDVSVDGHSWSTAAFVTDLLDKMWPAQYSHRGNIMQDPQQKLARPRAGYIWERALDKGMTVRSYGEQVNVKSLQGRTATDYRPKDPEMPWRDSDRARIFLREFDQFERDGNLPQLIVMSLPENHTAGTRPGAFTPIAQVASNDFALGQIVQRVSRSKFWSETAILVVEDDAQNGPDHVDSHRSVALVISPYSRLGRTDSTFYTTCSVLRTIELLLGLDPLTQYDAAAYPMFASFEKKANLSPYEPLDARVDLSAKNPPNAYGAQASLRMNFDEVDEAPEDELNEILWKSIKGPNSPMPPPVRRMLPVAAYRPAR